MDRYKNKVKTILERRENRRKRGRRKRKGRRERLKRKKGGDGDVKRSDRNEVMVTKLKLPAKLIQGTSMEAKAVLPKNLLINLLIVSRFHERQMRSTGLKSNLVGVDINNLTKFKSEPITQNNGR